VFSNSSKPLVSAKETSTLAPPLARVMQHDMKNGNFPFVNLAERISRIEGSTPLSKLSDDSPWFNIDRTITHGNSYKYLENGVKPSKYNMWAPSLSLYKKYAKK